MATRFTDTCRAAVGQTRCKTLSLGRIRDMSVLVPALPPAQPAASRLSAEALCVLVSPSAVRGLGLNSP